MTDQEQLQELKKICELIKTERPKRKALPTFALESHVEQQTITTLPRNIKKSLRAGIIFYSRGWGWRLRLSWQETLLEKMKNTKIYT